MPIANKHTYLADLVAELNLQYPDNHIMNIVCHGHSVPAGYFAHAVVDTFNAYPHLLHRALKDRFPHAVINVIVTAIGGEESGGGAGRFESEVMCHLPRLLTIDYGLNDRGIGLEKAEVAWRAMIEKALSGDIKLILLTPTADVRGMLDSGEEWVSLQRHAEQIRRLAAEYGVGLVDSLAAFEGYASRAGDIADLMSWPNHPNRRGHEIVALELMRWFPVNG